LQIAEIPLGEVPALGEFVIFDNSKYAAILELSTDFLASKMLTNYIRVTPTWSVDAEHAHKRP